MEPLQRQFSLFSLRLEPGRGRTEEYRRELASLAEAFRKLESHRTQFIAYGSRQANLLYEKVLGAAHDAVSWAADFNGAAYDDLVAIYKGRLRIFEGVVQGELR